MQNKIKTIGVISFSMEDFMNWKHENKLKSENRYICILKIEHCCGFVFDEIIETKCAYANKEYDAIKESIYKLILNKNEKYG